MECGSSGVTPPPIGDLIGTDRQLTNRIRSIHEQADLLFALAEESVTRRAQPAVLGPAPPLGCSNGENFVDHLCRKGFLLENV